jgi:hypothetical protein
MHIYNRNNVLSSLSQKNIDVNYIYNEQTIFQIYEHRMTLTVLSKYNCSQTKDKQTSTPYY